MDGCKCPDKQTAAVHRSTWTKGAFQQTSRASPSWDLYEDPNGPVCCVDEAEGGMGRKEGKVGWRTSGTMQGEERNRRRNESRISKAFRKRRRLYSLSLSVFSEVLYVLKTGFFLPVRLSFKKRKETFLKPTDSSLITAHRPAVRFSHAAACEETGRQ